MGNGTFPLMTIVKAIFAALQFIGAKPNQIVPHNGEQEKLVARLKRGFADLKLLPELQAWASRSAEALNELLAAANVEIRLDPWPDDGKHFGIVAIAKYAVKWLVIGITEEENYEGKMEPVQLNGKPAFKHNKKAAGIKFFQTQNFSMVAEIATQSGDKVYVSMQTPSEGGWTLLELIEAIEQEMTPANQSDWLGVILPKVKTSKKGVLEWLLGLEIMGWFITQAKSQTDFAMDEYGYTAQDVVLVGGTLGHNPEFLEFKDDFVFWVRRNGDNEVDAPIFMIVVEQDDRIQA